MKPDSESERSALDWPRHTGTTEVVLRAIEVQVSRRKRRGVTRALAGLAVCLAAALTWQIVRTPAPSFPPASILVTSPARRVLPDGSVVELSDGAKIAVDYAGALRRVALERGAAHFQVAKNSSRPFVVSARNVEIRDIGTVFEVRLDPDEVRRFGEVYAKGELPTRLVTDKIIDALAIAGAPDRCRATLAELVDAGIQHPVAFEIPGVAGDETVASVHRHLMPHFL